MGAELVGLAAGDHEGFTKVQWNQGTVEQLPPHCNPNSANRYASSEISLKRIARRSTSWQVGIFRPACTVHKRYYFIKHQVAMYWEVGSLPRAADGRTYCIFDRKYRRRSLLILTYLR